MKTLGLAFSALLAACSLEAVELGDTRAAVVAEKGPPGGQMVAEGLELLRYSDMTIRLQDGRVVGVEKAPQSLAPPGPAPIQESLNVKAVFGPNGLAEAHFPRRFVGNPEFHTTVGIQSAGTAFVARRPDDPQEYILTVQHLLGPMGGFDTLMTHAQVPSSVQAIRLDLFFGAPGWHPVAGCLVPVGDDPKGPLPELAAFKVRGVALEDTALLEPVSPAVGSLVWVIAHVAGGVPEGAFAHRAKVVGTDGRWLECEFDNPHIITNGASGAPVIDARGHVVGIYQGHADENGHKIAYIIAAPLIIETLRQL